MTRKRTKAAYGSRLRLTAAAAVLCACVLCGCSDNEPGHSDVTTAPQATAAQQASVEVTEKEEESPDDKEMAEELELMDSSLEIVDEEDS